MSTADPAGLTIVIPTLNREQVVLDTLRSLEEQTVPGFEVLVVDQSDEFPSRLADFTSQANSYRLHHIEEQNLPNARNVAAKLATGDLLVFIDDDVVPDPNLAGAYLREFQRLGDDYWIVAGRIWEAGSELFSQSDRIVGGTVTFYGKSLRNFDTDNSGDCHYAAGGNFGVRKARYLELGGFDAGIRGTALFEDADFSYRAREAGGKLYFSPLPSLQHLRIPTGGTRQWTASRLAYDRAYNTVSFFRRHKPAWQLPFVLLYLQAVALKEWLSGAHPPGAILQGWRGFLRAMFA